MCPKCKSRERERLLDKIHHRLCGRTQNGDYWVRNEGMDTRVYLFLREAIEYFFCSNCGYEIGRWG